MHGVTGRVDSLIPAVDGMTLAIAIASADVPLPVSLLGIVSGSVTTMRSAHDHVIPTTN